MKLKTKSVKIYTTSDGREFEDKHEALAHEAGLNLIRFLTVAVSEETGHRILDAIKADIQGFREVIGPLLRRPRSKREPQVPGIDLNEVDPVRPAEKILQSIRESRARDTERASALQPAHELVYEPLDVAEAAEAEQEPPKRRGRPPGSKNKPKANGGEARSVEP